MEEKPRQSMGLCVSILKIGGLWHTRDMTHRNAILYNILKTFVVIVFCTITLEVYLYLLLMWGSFEDMFETIAYCITMTVLALKFHVMLFRSEEVNHIVQTIQENFIIHGSELSTENRQIIRNTIKLARKVVIAYATMQTSSLATYTILGPLISFSVPLQTQNATNISYETRISDRKLPFELWFPVDVSQYPRFEIAYVYLSATGIVNSWSVVAIEVFCMTTFIYIAGQFELLSDSIRNASERVIYRLNEIQHSSASIDDIDTPQKFTSDKKMKIQYSNANTELSVIPATGKVNITQRILMTSTTLLP